MSHLGFTRNEYGTLVSAHRCDTCGGDFTVCPPIMADEKGWDDCLANWCHSYDQDRDVNDVFDSMSSAGEIGHRHIPED